MTAATDFRPGHCSRLLVLDPRGRRWADRRFASLPDLLRPGDVLVVNDAFTLPASLTAQVAGVDVEIRLAGPVDEGWAVLFGPGSWRLSTEARPPPPIVGPGDVLHVAGQPVRVLEVSPISDRLVRLALPEAMVWRHGAPVQYRYMARDLALTEVQTPYAARPWATEMPSAGRPLTIAVQRQLTRAGVRILPLTHAAGLSATGDPLLDAALPLPERYDVPAATWRDVQRAHRVIAVGTSVARALESAARGPLAGVTTLRIGPETRLQVVDGLLSGMHEPGESHFAMMAAFADLAWLVDASRHAANAGYRNHEFGDSTLVLDDVLAEPRKRRRRGPVDSIVGGILRA